MGYSSWDRKESDTTERLHSLRKKKQNWYQLRERPLLAVLSTVSAL